MSKRAKAKPQEPSLFDKPAKGTKASKKKPEDKQGKTSVPDKVTPRLYGGIPIGELVSRFEAFAKEYDGKYSPSHWNGTGTVEFTAVKFEKVAEAMNKISILSFKHEFTCTFRTRMFSGEEHGFRYAVSINLPGILQTSAFS